MKIQSESDIITNSSSEAFMIVNKNSITSIKQAIAPLLRMMHIDETIDNVLEIVPAYDNYKKAIEHLILTGRCAPDYSEEYGEGRRSWNVDGYPVCSGKSEITPEIFEKAVYDFMDETCYKSDYPLIHDIKIKPKKPQYKQLADSIHNILYSTDYEAFYC
ncbi:MAG: hypothetical protein [Wendovervirus sonii]|uniref:Head completion protein n=1 Tax=phage Lak_Megaphage_Sonny TaxID=3109229 RepID=A0ABZ0Z4M2_9CAUD|nr:MAG: hypothetical protein [phage Lak_Megaphage_Sonny]